jgi:hypothetical protein
VVTAALVALVVALPLGAHVERDPVLAIVNPAPDTSIIPAAGGDFVDGRTLTDPTKRLDSFKRFVAKARKTTPAFREEVLARFVRLSEDQQAAARKLLGASRVKELGLDDPRIQAEETLVVCKQASMTRLRSALKKRTLASSKKKNRKAKAQLLDLNETFASLCRFSEIQAAVNAADNNDTIVVMPGFYTEPTSRKAPHNDPKCASMVATGTRSAPAPTYEYHFECPNDINLIAVMGREKGDTGKCIRCNLAIIGASGRSSDVIVDAGAEPKDPGPAGRVFEVGKKGGPTHNERGKEVGLRLERTDGAYVANLTVNHANEHGFYSIEADGVTFDNVDAYYNREYGHLSFVTDHLIVQDGDFAGAGDAGIYPGASPVSEPRLNSIIRRNRSHHNAIGISGSMGSNLHIVDNDFDNNSTGITLDSVSRAGHPGFPQRGTHVTGNRIFSNNFDTYSEDAWVRSTVQAPIGSGILFGGGNDNVVSRNHIYDNWRWGAGLLSVPDIVTEQDSPDDAKMSTSHRNRFILNDMGVAPDGASMPNGVDYWWDGLGEQNCWETKEGQTSTSATGLPNCQAFPNVGTGNPVVESEIVVCNFVADRKSGTPGCSWYDVPEKP